MTQPSAKKHYIVLGDIHEEISHFTDIPELAGAAGVIVSGDITQCGGTAKAQAVMDVIAGTSACIYAQIGNMDYGDVTAWLQQKGWNLHAQMHTLLPDVAIFGVGASLTTPFGTPSEFTEEDYARWLRQVWEKACACPKSVLVSHNPPKDTKCDVIGNGMHVGSVAVREFIEKEQPDICICGHIHESRAVDSIGHTVVVNPGNFGSGGYAVLEYHEGNLSVALKQL